MKKYIALLFMMAIFPVGIHAAEKNMAQDMYQACDSEIPAVKERDTIRGNIQDVQRERELRACLKQKLFSLIPDTLLPSQAEKFKQTINNLEENYTQYYTALIFCNKDSSEQWCTERAQDDMSLESLMREKNVTAQMVQQISELIETIRTMRDFD